MERRSFPPLRPARIARATCRFLFLAALLCSLTACAGSTPLLVRADATVLHWPDRPAAAQIEWVKTVAIPEDAGIAKGFWKKALELVTGADTSRFVKPYGVLYDDSGRLVVADPGAGVVHVMDTKAARYSTITSASGAPLRSPIGLAEDQENGLYITDSVTNAVYRYDLALRTLAPFLAGIKRPTGIAYNKVSKLLYISETGGDDVVAVDLKGAIKRRFSKTMPAGQGFNHPTDLAVDLKGQVYVTDPLNFMVRVFTPEGLQVAAFGEMGDARKELSKPKGIAVDEKGRIFLCDAMLDMVKVFEANGQLLFTVGSNGTGNGGFWMPSGIFISQKYLFVTDTYNRRVQIFKMIKGAESDDDAMVETGRVSMGYGR